MERRIDFDVYEYRTVKKFKEDKGEISFKEIKLYQKPGPIEEHILQTDSEKIDLDRDVFKELSFFLSNMSSEKKFIGRYEVLDRNGMSEKVSFSFIIKEKESEVY